MPNESMTVMAVMARKGGSGKSMLVKALASAAAASDRRALLIDSDPQGDTAAWFARAQAGKMIPATASLIAVDDAEQLGEAIERAYRDDTADFVFVDTAGSAGAWADQVAMLSDVVVTPVLASESDLLVGKQTVEWFRGLAKRVDSTAELPPHRIVLTNFPTRPTKLEGALMKTAMAEFSVVNTVVQHRSAYLAMDKMGFLGNILEGYRTDTSILERGRARHFEDALVESICVLNDLLEPR